VQLYKVNYSKVVKCVMIALVWKSNDSVNNIIPRFQPVKPIGKSGTTYIICTWLIILAPTVSIKQMEEQSKTIWWTYPQSAILVSIGLPIGARSFEVGINPLSSGWQVAPPLTDDAAELNDVIDSKDFKELCKKYYLIEQCWASRKITRI
jgi:hypothetical protein